MVDKALGGEGAATEREYTVAERNLNRFIRENFPEWGCKAV
jgi:sulfate adenylyltransferase subunit 1